MNNGWQIRSLGSLCDVIGGGTPSKSNAEYYCGSIPWATVRDMRSEVITETECEITKEAVRASATNIIPKGNVIIATRVGLGKVCLLGQDTAINQDLRGIVPTNPSVLSVRFLYWWLRSMKDKIVAEGTGATVQGVKLPFVKALQVPLPPLSEQQRIVSILDEAFESVGTAKANAEKNVANARALFQIYLQAVFSRRGPCWREFRLGDVCERLHQGLNTAGEKVKFYDSGYPIIQTRNIDNRLIDLESKIKFMCEEDWQRYRDKYRPEMGDVFFTNIGTIGKTAIVKLECDYLIHWNIFKLRPRFESVTSEFLEYTLMYLTLSGHFEKLQKGGTVNFVTKKMISDAVIHLPSVVEQKRIVSTLEDLHTQTERLVSRYGCKLAAIDELKNSLLHHAFTGRL